MATSINGQLRAQCGCGLLLGLLLVALPGTGAADEIPAGTVLHVRLQQPVSSFGSEQDDGLVLALIAPIQNGDLVLAPLGSSISGYVERTRRVGLGLSREVALLELSFERLRLPDGTEHALQAVVAGIDDARETVDAETGLIRGVRATSSLSTTLAGLAVSAGALDPMLMGFTVTMSVSTFRIPESEIIFPAGTELTLRLTRPLWLTTSFGPIAPAPSPGFEQAVPPLVKSLPFRTATEKTNVPSDLTNLLFLGSREALMRAFDAAGWARTDALSSASTYATLRSIVENQGYLEAPVSTLLLDGAAPALTYAKTLNTFFKRHHARVFGSLGTFDGVEAWTASSTHDSGIGFATRAKTFIHVIDNDIDEERQKIVYDLILTGCVDSMVLVDRPWVPRDAFNATGDALITDGRIAVVRLNDCAQPSRADKPVTAPSERPKPRGIERVARDMTLWVKNDAFRGNIVYQGYAGVRRGIGALAGLKKHSSTERVIRFGGQEFRVVPGIAASDHELGPDDPADEGPPSFYPIAAPRRSYASTLEFSIHGGYSTFANRLFSTQPLDLIVPLNAGGQAVFRSDLDTELTEGWNVALKGRLNPHRYISHEFGFTYSDTVLEVTATSPFASPEDLTAPAHIRQFSYNVIANARPTGSRWRPYAAVGPAMQLIRLTGGIGGGRFSRLAFRDVGLIAATWNFGSDPPLEGGSIFQAALVYGAGFQFFFTPHLHIRTDFRESISEQPDFWKESYASIAGRIEGVGVIVPGEVQLHGPLRHSNWTVGMGVSF